MKRTIIILLGLLSCMAVLSVIGQKKVLSPKEERREVREKRRAERIANYTKSMDSLVLRAISSSIRRRCSASRPVRCVRS